MTRDDNAAAADATVLVVDDDPRTRDFLAKVLREEGYRVVTAADGSAAVTMATQVHPRIILLDIVMPGMDGLAALRELKRQGQRGIVIVVTAQGTLPTAREALLLGAYAYMTKPFNLKLLKSVIREALRERAGAGEESTCAR
ncbi:MAG: response regulator [Myxococcota bacterium]|nr:response regulator [Myxococcota bacterium]